MFFVEGNKSLLTFVKCSPNNPDDLNVSKGPPDVSDAGLVMYNGALLDIAKLLQQLQRSEKARIDTEQKLSDLQDELRKLCNNCFKFLIFLYY